MSDSALWSGLFVQHGDMRKKVSGSLAHNGGALDFERMSHFAWCQCFAIWLDDTTCASEAAALDFYRTSRDRFKDSIATCAGATLQVRDVRDIDAAVADGKTAALLTVENARMIGDLSVVEEMAEDGVKMASLSWNGANQLASGNETHDSLSHLGRCAVRAFEDARIVVDVSHLNEQSFWDLASVARRPFVASHSNARGVCNVPRNLTDDQFRAIRDSGGLVGLNYYRAFLSSRNAFEDGCEVTFDEVAAHVEHWLELDGGDTVSLGSDYDGGDVPAWLDVLQSEKSKKGKPRT